MLSRKQAAKVGDFDFNIERCRQWRAEALQDIRDLESGTHWFRNDEDVTDKMVAKAHRIVTEMDILIAAFESLDCTPWLRHG
jgi:hypothetical protein